MTYKDKLADTRNNLRNMRKAIPDTFAGFVALEQAASADGALDKKQKEFIALGIAVALRCEDCILTHVSALVRIGATREEIGEILGTSIQMAGGPGLMYAAKALAVFDELSAD
ncbi:MAG: carboxymuconolactone decarboxylase family protein [Salipiger thiooxidans]|jgi:AhpD family alkylhydroperoxidase|uniref:Alkylhydroperoxidase AhpD family core domain-containing protein n=1 Tax=Salipiger thiooxidans TaxID=282683 RepID=A0A1G7F481_9RHOB|nr:MULTISPECIES: carboxymuconolactone decarboxylase family protein [Salipiger]EEX16461.1 4-carboxymuconolactone decarboxylase family protein [Citreicella sp. SE45]MAU48079.1 carboxymuconolactone decarboxylase family protein [Salipiger sp.]MBR9840913.1 carboxymuconolactone decarboxylase family protein [Paracoccaceae bacterium]MBN8186875.1 carboxymuconolactone decarboxylase family protein [Salipiger thiooxidans]MCA0846801.1 carboxymuconolactone decarboxylase family protein [Salipiger thiooxidans